MPFTLAYPSPTPTTGTREDIKKAANAEEASEKLTFCDKPLGEALARLGLTVEDVWPGQVCLEMGRFEMLQCVRRHLSTFTLVPFWDL